MCNDGSELNPTEAIFAFTSWLTTRHDTTMLGRRIDTAAAVERINEFMAMNPGLPPCRDDYTKLYELPEEEWDFQV